MRLFALLVFLASLIIAPSAQAQTSQTITFNDAQPNHQLIGQYPTGVVDWGSGAFWVSGPYKLFTTNSLTFANFMATSGTFTLINPTSTLVSLQAFNSGFGTITTVVLQCNSNLEGNPKVIRSVPYGITAITTGWAYPCASITIAPGNARYMYFDDLVIS